MTLVNFGKIPRECRKYSPQILERTTMNPINILSKFWEYQQKTLYNFLRNFMRNIYSLCKTVGTITTIRRILIKSSKNFNELRESFKIWLKIQVRLQKESKEKSIWKSWQESTTNIFLGFDRKSNQVLSIQSLLWFCPIWSFLNIHTVWCYLLVGFLNQISLK